MKKILSFFAMFEGFDHLILSAISFWGFYQHHIGIVQDWNLWITPLADTVFGFMSILTGYVLNRTVDKEKAQK